MRKSKLKIFYHPDLEDEIKAALIEEIGKERGMVGVKVNIELTGNLPKKYLSRLREVSDWIKDDACKTFGEYEIWGEFFGDDPEVYTFFLTGVKVEGSQ